MSNLQRPARVACPNQRWRAALRQSVGASGAVAACRLPPRRPPPASFTAVEVRRRTGRAARALVSLSEHSNSGGARRATTNQPMPLSHPAAGARAALCTPLLSISCLRARGHPGPLTPHLLHPPSSTVFSAAPSRPFPVTPCSVGTRPLLPSPLPLPAQQQRQHAARNLLPGGPPGRHRRGGRASWPRAGAHPRLPGPAQRGAAARGGRAGRMGGQAPAPCSFLAHRTLHVSQYYASFLRIPTGALQASLWSGWR